MTGEQRSDANTPPLVYERLELRSENSENSSESLGENSYERTSSESNRRKNAG